MNRKDAIKILRGGEGLTDEAALLLLLVKYSGKLTKADELIIENLRFCCPLCQIHCNNSHCQDKGACPWLRFTDFNSLSGDKACVKWRRSQDSSIEVKFAELPEHILNKRIEMIKDWLKIIRAAK